MIERTTKKIEELKQIIAGAKTEVELTGCDLLTAALVEIEGILELAVVAEIERGVAE